MRNPSNSLLRVKGATEAGTAVKELLDTALDTWPMLLQPARAILEGDEPQDYPDNLIEVIRSSVLTLLGATKEQRTRRRTAAASTPLRADIIEAWSNVADDPDSSTLAAWLDHGAPLGITQQIPSHGVFPPAAEMEKIEADHIQRRSLEGWENYGSAQEEAEDLKALIQDYVDRGFCRVVKPDQAEKELGPDYVLNELGVVVKTKQDAQGRWVKKFRIIWDLKESQVNKACCQGERVLLPRLLDVVASVLKAYRDGLKPHLAGVDIRDAFMNIPAGVDKAFTTAALPGTRNKPMVVVFDTLVFGSASSPTVWGRFAAWLGRTTAAIARNSPQVYVDDPVYVMAGDLEQATRSPSHALLWAVAGFPVKTSKATCGKQIEWIGAKLACQDDTKTVTVSIPEAKVTQLLDDTDKILAKPVVGSKVLRSYAGALSFVAGLVPHLRPFLSTLWAALSQHVLAASE